MFNLFILFTIMTYEPPQPLTAADRSSIIHLYTVDHLSMREISTRVNRSPSSIRSVLIDSGVDTRRSVAGRIQSSCAYCESSFTVFRSAAKRRRSLFCSVDCYSSWLQVRSEHISTVGLSTITLFYPKIVDLPSPPSLHRIDGLLANISPRNLILFSSFLDHIRFHRGLEVEPLFDGRRSSFTALRLWEKGDFVSLNDLLRQKG